MSKKTLAVKPEKQFPGQHEGEEVDFVFRQHPLVMRKALIGGLLVIVVSVLPLDFPQIYSNEWLAGLLLKVMIGGVVLVFAAWFYRWVGWYYTLYIVTDRRILEIKQRGLFDRKVNEWQLDGISNVNYHIGGFQAVIFGFGDITARTYIGDLEMKTIHKPAEVHAQLVEAVRRAGGGAAMNSGSTQPVN
jgi:polyferredoxin